MTLITPRLTLRPLIPADAPAIAGALGDLDVSRWLLRAPQPYDPADAEAFIAAVRAEHRNVWAICPGGDSLVGLIGLHGSFGYWLAREAWGKGYATEAGEAVLDWHFDRSDALLDSGHFEGNTRSARVLEKLGFTYTGRARLVTPVSTGEPVRFHPMQLTRSQRDRLQAAA